MATDTVTVRVAPELTLTIKLNGDHYRQAIGLDREQINMLRAVFEDTYGVDPAKLTGKEIAAKARASAA